MPPRTTAAVTLCLHLLRHAKSSWDDPGLDDHERPLAARGRKAARRLRRYALEHGVRPQLAVCSTAARARETLERVAPGLGTPAVVYDGRLYLASAADLLDRLHEVADDATEVLLVGHDPGLQELALALARPDGRERLAASLPTGALVTLVLPAERFAEVEAGTGELTRLVVPRELT